MKKTIQALLSQRPITLHKPSNAKLNEILTYFLHSISFTTLGIHNNAPLTTNPFMALQDVFKHHRGGSCFQINTALYYVLKMLGYQAKLYGTRVKATYDHLYNFTQDSHMTLAVTIGDTSYIVDPGWGSIPNEALPINGDEKNQGHLRWRAHQEENSELVEIQVYSTDKKHWQCQFYFDLRTPLQLNEFTPLVEYVSSKDYEFYKTFLCIRTTDSGKYVLINDTFYFEKLTGERETFSIQDYDGIRNILIKVFELTSSYVDSLSFDHCSTELSTLFKLHWNQAPVKISSTQSAMLVTTEVLDKFSVSSTSSIHETSDNQPGH